VIWGEYVYINSSSHGSGGNGAPMVAIEASSDNPITSTAGNYTFYGRLDATPWNADDDREPLATNFAARYVRDATYAVAWRDPKVAQHSFTCGNLPDWYPLGREAFALFDEQEHATVRAGSLASPTNVGNAFPAAANKVLVGTQQIPSPYASGWIYMNLNTFVTPAGDVPPIDMNAAQAYVTMIRELPGGTFGNVGAAGDPAFRLDSAAAAVHFTP
jgi:hypothetical protein